MPIGLDGKTAPADPDNRFRVHRAPAVLRHSVTESIRNAIFVGRFRSGDRLPERELCEMTGVSRTLVREALRQLEAEHLIQIVPYRGPVVATITIEQAADLYRVREELEGLAGQLFAERATAGHLAALNQALQGLQDSYTRGTDLERLQAKDRFYECLLDGAGNEALSNSLHLLNSRVMLLRSMSLSDPGRAAKSLVELQGLVVALEAGDMRAARRAAVRHVRNAARVALRLLRTADAAAAPP